MSSWIAALAGLGLTVAVPGANAQPDVRYAITPVPGVDRTDLRIEMTFRGDSTGRSTLHLPRDRFGVPDMHRSVEVVGIRGAELEPAAEAGIQPLSHPPNGAVAVEYRVSWDPASSAGLAFSPSVDEGHFHFLGPQWMARVGPADRPVTIEVRFLDLPSGWVVAGSFGEGAGPHVARATYDELVWTVIAGGRYREDRFACGGRGGTFVHGAFAVSDQELFRLARGIVCRELEIFGGADSGFFSVILTAREGIEAGAPLIGGFTALIEPEASPLELGHLLAHEMVHTWLPRSVRLVRSRDAEPSPVRHQWFHEGFTEFLARRVVVEAGLASRDWLVERFNEDLHELAIHPNRATSLEELETADRDGRFDNLMKRLGYIRGAVIALNHDAAIRRASDGERDLLDAIREAVAEGVERSGTLEEEALHRILGAAGAPSREVFEAHVLDAAPIRPDSNAFAPDYVLTYDSLPAFDAGFDVLASVQRDTLVGVRPDGPAHRAGLRNGMPLVQARRTATLDPDRPVSVTVAPGGETRTVEYLPAGELVEVPRFEPRPR